MGNCFASSKIVSENAMFDQQSNEADQMIEKTTRPFVPLAKIERGGKAKMVRFRLNEEVNVDKDGDLGDETASKGGGAVRIRVVVTKEELKQILNFRENINYSSVEQLVSALRLRERSRPDEGGTSTDGRIMCGGWKPLLGSIPEDR
ncbi:PREDICTED: uncharacterized protein LOC105141672 [Populus euphratica]|uniref:Uncharacterized protein LOC105141672 n=1 Tax=Populus euphratica TaxID=75702 RepID=A0AAJ6VGJ8_POPEU|nr:PREDICTED: uncharacterized protein LOC105141672 [Populus euphratica]